MTNTTVQTAPLTGVVQQVVAQQGQSVNQGDLIAIIESMKVHVRIEAESSGQLARLELIEGHTIERGQRILEIFESTTLQTNSVAPTPSTSQEPHPAIAKWQQRQSLTLDSKRPQAVERRRQKNYCTARENLANLCDVDEFQEYGQLAVAAQRQRQDYETLKTTTAADGVITGVGTVQGIPTAMVINDYSVLAGTQGYFHHQKIDRILEVAEQRKLPVIMFTEGGGGRPGDTDVTVVNSGLQCTSFGTWAGLSGVVPRITIANGYNFAGNAALFGAGDITIGTRSSWIGMAGPAMIAGGGLGDFKPTDIGPIETQSQNGVVDIVVDDEKQACLIAQKVLSLLADQRQGDWTSADQSALNSILPENRRVTYEVRDILNIVADEGSVVELKVNHGRSVVTALMRIQGRSVGVIANDCKALGGAVDVESGQKTNAFMQLCDDFGLPIISFCDTPGFMVGPDHEQLGAVRKLASLFKVGAQLSVPFYAVVLRKCYGLGAQAMLAGSTQRPLYMMSWPTGEFGAMGLESAVTLGFRKELEAAPSEQARTELFNQLLAEQYDKGSAMEVASVLELDAVIAPADTRAQLARLLCSDSL